jgi:hypothetical protein
MQSKFLTFIFCLFLAITLQAQAPTWANDIAPIFYKHCTSCHRVGGVGDFPLETWTDAQNNAYGLLNSVETRYMPPWRALPSYRHFKDENYLTDEQIQTIADWVNGGQLPGDLTQAPPLPNYQNGSQLTAVDMVIETPQYTLVQSTDLYRAFVIPTGVTTDKFFNEVEFLPGNDAIIHHIVVYTDPTNEPVIKDQADPGPGFSTNGMVGGITDNATLIAEWTPGGTPIKMPANFGYRIPANGYFIIEIHFAPNHVGQTDEGSVVNLKLSNNNPRELYYGVLAQADSTQGLLNPPFIIPANTIHTLKTDFPMTNLAPVSMSLFTLTPHAHVRGKSFKSFAYRIGQTDTIPLIDIPEWDFYWQGTYTLQKPVRLRTTHRIRTNVAYDNTVDNPNNPVIPPVDAHWGEKTSDEMLFLFATLAIYQAGDENIILDSLVLTATPEIVVQDEKYKIVNPMTDALDIRSVAENQGFSGTSDLFLTDMNGKIVRQWREKGLQHSRTSVASLAAGTYVLHIRDEKGQESVYKLIKS